MNVLNEAMAEELLTHCEDTTEREMVSSLTAAGFPEGHPLYPFLVSTIRMAAATGARHMFVELARRGYLPSPPLPPCPVCGAALSNVDGEFSAAKPQAHGITVPCGHRVVATIHADGRIEVVPA